TVNTNVARRRLALDAGRLRNRSSSLLIVFGSQVVIMQDAIRFIKRLHRFFRATAIGVPLVRQSTVRPFNLATRRILAGAQDLVIILLRIELAQRVDFSFAFAAWQRNQLWR